MTPWLILRPVSGWELKAVRSLKQAGFNAYVPTKTVWNRLVREGDARRDRPLFPGYVFVEQPGNMTQLVEMVENRQLYGVSGFHWTHGGPEKEHMSSRNGWVEAMMQAQEEGAFDYTKPRPKWRPKKGERVKIAHGPFSEFIAHVVEVRGDKCVRLMLEMFGKQQAMTIKLEQVRAA